MTKKCKKCGMEKDLTTDNFGLHKISKDGFNTVCKECNKEIGAERYKRDKEKILEQKKEYYQGNKEQIKERQNEYYHNNLDKCHGFERNWRMNNPHKRRIVNERRRSIERNVQSTLNDEEWLRTKSHFDHSCAYCGMSESDHLDKYGELLHHEHLIPIANGGDYSENNVIPSCRGCNSSKKNKVFSEWYRAYKHYDKSRECKILDFAERGPYG